MIASLVGRTKWLIGARSSAAAVVQTTVMQIVTLVANLATGILTARLLAPAGRGELAAINLLPSLMGYLLTFGIPGALLYHLRRNKDGARATTGAAIVIACVLGCVGVVIGYAIMPYALRRYSPHVIQMAQLFMLTTPLSLLMYVCSSVFESAGDFWYSNSTKFLSPLITLASLIIFWATGRLDVLTAAISYALPSLPIGVRMLVSVLRCFHPRFLPFVRDVYRELFSYGLRSFGIEIINVVGGQIDQVLVITFLSPAAMGLYAVALAGSRVLQIFQSSVVRVLLPRIAARPLREVVDAVGKAMRITTALTAPVCAAVILLAPLLLGLAYGGKFVAAAPVLRVLAFEAPFAGATWILAQAFLGVGKPGAVTVLQAAGLACSFPLMLVLIPRFGLLGAGFALLISTLVRFALVLASYPLLLNTQPPPLLLTRNDIATLLGRLRAKQSPPVDS
jgi:antigen flippase